MRRLLLAIALIFPIAAYAQVRPEETGRFIVTFRAGTPQAERAAAVQRGGAALRFNYAVVDAAAITVPNANALAALRNNPSVLSIVPDRSVFAFQNGRGIGGTAKPGSRGGGTTTGQVIPEGVKRVGEPMAGVSDGQGIGVAILDTGIDLAHADLQANIAPDMFASPSFGTTCQDDNGHGTHVAGIVGAANNQIGTIGVASGATLYCVKVLDASGSGSDSDVIAGLDWVFGRAAIRVVNMSLGRPASADPADDEPMRAAIERLHNSGVTVIVAAGNDPTKEAKDMTPANFAEAIAVASTTAIDGSNACRRFSGVIRADTASYFTTDGNTVAISAPGEDSENINKGCMISAVGILSAKLGGGTTRMSGTSMASPHVAGVAARILQQENLTPDQVRARIQATAQNSGAAPLDSPTSSYTFDGSREGVVLAPPYPVP